MLSILLDTNLILQTESVALDDSFKDQLTGVSYMAIAVVVSIIGLAIFMNVRSRLRRVALEKKVAERAQEVYDQKKELEKRAKALEKANGQIQKQNEDILQKNQEIEKALEKLNINNQELTDLNREKDGMMSVVAHDLRTPLNNIQGLIQLITLDGTLNDEQNEYVNTIKTVVQRGNEMIRDLLDINKAQSQDTVINKKEVDLEKYISKWKSNFDKPLNEKSQRLIVSGTIEGVKVMTDDGLLSRILDNLTSNAMKFSDPGKNIYLKMKVTKTKLGLILKDEGPGISKEDQEKMFKPFTKLSARPTAGEASNGLGLSIIKSLVEKLGGTIEVKSELGKGTAFLIAIPIV